MYMMGTRQPVASGVLRPDTGEDKNGRTARCTQEVVANARTVDRAVPGSYSTERSFLCRYHIALSSGSLGRVALSAGWKPGAGTRAPIALPGSVTAKVRGGWLYDSTRNYLGQLAVYHKYLNANSDSDEPNQDTKCQKADWPRPKHERSASLLSRE